MNRPIALLSFFSLLPFCASAGAADFGPKRVLAFYYTWYATEAFSGKWLHYANVDTAKQDIGNWRYWPAIGPYDSHDPAVLDLHMKQMQEAGIDGPITTWWGPKDWNDQALPILLDKAQAHGRVVTVYYETTAKTDATDEKAAERLAYVIQTHTSHPAWLKVNGRPVIFIYVRAVNEIKPAERWTTIRKLVVEKTGVDPFLVGDGINDANAKVFDGTHQYNTAGRLRGLDKPEEMRRAIAGIELTSELVPRRHGKLACYTVIPGYDDTKNRTPGLAIPRLDGQTYDIGWEGGIGRDVDWTLICTWNEWHEGSVIEPCKEFGDKYLKATAEWSKKFKDPNAKPIAAPPDPAWAPFVKAWKGGKVAVLGGPQGIGMDLLAPGLPTRLFSLEEFAQGKLKAAECPIAVYTEGEPFKNDYGEGKTVEAAFKQYGKDGGVVVFASWQPWPLFKDLDTGETSWSKRIGLPLAMSWEKTPPEQGIVVRDNATKADEPYPTSGDLRFRPSVAPTKDEGCDYRAWLTVFGPTGKRYGDALSSYVYKSGPYAPARFLYAWQGMWSMSDPVRRMQDVLMKAAGLR
ncbi:MAG: glycoside hydrolase family 99-like domain-containing protein [Candidatus Sumerlaeota bacterium]|nr:glycoside hydrolase family 99-like domain-containing protein [Candidatus Sumerlaeota bacterium]